MLKKNNLVHLNVQVNSNLSFSLLTIKNLVDYAVRENFTCLAISDFFPYAVWDFFQICQEKKIKPIWGAKFFFLFQDNPKVKFLVTAFPKNNNGYRDVYKNLFSFNSAFNRTFYSKEIIFFLAKNCFLVFQVSSWDDVQMFFRCWSSVDSEKKINEEGIFLGFDFFLFSPKTNIPPTWYNNFLPFFPVKALTSKQKKNLFLLQETVFFSSFFEEEKQTSFCSYDVLVDSDYFFQLCTNDKDFFFSMLENWNVFLDKINFFSARLLKQKKSESSPKEENLLLEKCLVNLSQEKKDIYEKRLQKELIVIKNFGYCDYFLWVSEVLEELKKKKGIITSFGRGSSVSSLVSFLLNITKVDPLEHGLFFERFLNEYRSVLPDIDVDVDNQEKVFDYLFQESVYQQKHQLARIILRKKIGWKSAVTESIKLFSVDEKEFKEVMFLINEQTLNCAENDSKLKYWRYRFPDFFSFVEDIYQLFFETCLHSSGVVFSQKNLLGVVPMAEYNNYPVVFWSKNELNCLGIKKCDFLSLKEPLEIVKLVKQKDCFLTEIPASFQLNLEDKKTWNLFNNILLTKIFQLDTVVSRSLWFKMKPKNFSQLVVFLAVNRPGIIRRVGEIIKRKNSAVSPFLSLELSNILKDTFFSVLFEEQASEVLSFLYDCSFSLAEEKRRSLLVQKDFFKEEILKKTEEKKILFTDYQLIIKELFDYGYAFNKSHAVAYSFLVYYNAFLKANFFEQLIVYWLNNFVDKTLFFLQEAFFFSYEFLSPDVNCSFLKWHRKQNQLIMGFCFLKGYQEKFFSDLIEEREKNGRFKSIKDFFWRIVFFWSSSIDLNIFSGWIKVGFLRSCEENSNIVLGMVSQFFLFLRLKKTLSFSSEFDLPFLHFSPLNKKKIKEEISLVNRNELDVLGTFVSFFSRCYQLSSSKQITTLTDFTINCSENTKENNNCLLLAIIIEVFLSKNGQFYTLKLLDARGYSLVFITKKLFQKKKNLLIIYNECLFFLSVEFKNGYPTNLWCQEIESAF